MKNHLSQEEVIIVTGGANGLGRAIAIWFANKGCRAIVFDKTPQREISAELLKTIYRYIEIDITDVTQLDKSLNEIIQDIGRIDTLVNNAGIKIFNKLELLTTEEIQKAISVNFFALAVLTKKLIPIFKKQGYGNIINISSRAGFSGYQNGSIYCATKSAVNIFTQALAEELRGSNIRINTICPQNIATPENLANPKLNKTDLVSMENVIRAIDLVLQKKNSGRIIPIMTKKEIFISSIKNIKKYLLK